jgi:hypothetical protein
VFWNTIIKLALLNILITLIRKKENNIPYDAFYARNVPRDDDYYLL